MSSLLVKVGINGAGFKTGLASLKASAMSFKAGLTGMFSGLGGSLMGMLGLGGGIAGLTMLARQSIQLGSEISDLANQLRIGTTELQVLQRTANDAGVDSNTLTMALRNVNKNTQEAADGSAKLQESFARLNIDLKSFYVLPMDKKMAMLANAYKQSGESLSALSDISDIFGSKVGPQMVEVLDRIATEGMDSLTQSCIEAGNVMDEETIMSLDRAADEIGRWQNKIVVWFGTFLADMGSEVGRWKIGMQILQVFAEAVVWLENIFRDFGNYVMGFFASIGRYIGATFSDFIIPIRNVFFGFIESIGSALASFIGLFDKSWKRAVESAVAGLKQVKEEANTLNKADKGKGFGDIFSEEMSNAQSKNKARTKDDLLFGYATDFYDKEISQLNKLREAEKKIEVDREKARKAKYERADADVEIKSPDKKKEKTNYNFNDSMLARIGGGGLTAQRFDVPEKQLSESKKQTKVLEKIAENTENKATNSQLIMR